MLTTVHPFEVIERDGVTELCFGVMQSLPPGCAGGPRLAVWDWSAHEGQFTTQSGVTWGEFIVTGTYDAETGVLTPTEVTSGAGYEWPETEIPALPLPCAEPDGGWVVGDDSRAHGDAFYAAMDFARHLEGVGGVWQYTAPEGAILNVSVVGDLTAAETAMREVFTGMLCVSSATRTNAELQEILTELMPADEAGWSKGPDRLLTLGIDEVLGHVDLTVIYDEDGALQRRMDARYGPGLVRVGSALSPAD